MAKEGVLEVVIVSTCNRSEVYCYCQCDNYQAIIDWLIYYHKIEKDELLKSLYIYQDVEAIQHLFRVASGLNSLVLGEPQILGQIKQSFLIGTQAKTTKKMLNKWFQFAFTVAKRVRTETQIGANAISVAFAAVRLAKQIFSELSESRVLLVGAGETIELVGKYLIEHNVPNITIANRTLERAVNLVEKFNAQAITLGEIPDHLVNADIIISSTASPLPIIGKGMVETALKARRYQPMLFIDIAVPRDIEPQVTDLNDVYLYTVDDLQGIIEENKQARQVAALEAEKIIEGSVEDFYQWIESLGAVESIRLYREQSMALRDDLLEKAMFSLKTGADPEKTIQELAFKLTNKLIHHPSRALSESKRGADEKKLTILQNALGLN